MRMAVISSEVDDPLALPLDLTTGFFDSGSLRSE
jgi:hypothetical protein